MVFVQSLSCVWLFATPQTEARQASLSFTISQSLLNLMSTESVMPSNCLTLCCSFSFCLQSFPTSGSFPMSWFFASGGRSIGASTSASVLPNNIQHWFPLRLTALISLGVSKGLSRVFYSTAIQRHQFFSILHWYLATYRNVFHQPVSMTQLMSTEVTPGHGAFMTVSLKSIINSLGQRFCFGTN